MADDLEERLKADAAAFASLLELTPAKNYFGQDNSVCLSNSKLQTTTFNDFLGL